MGSAPAMPVGDVPGLGLLYRSAVGLFGVVTQLRDPSVDLLQVGESARGFGAACERVLDRPCGPNDFVGSIRGEFHTGRILWMALERWFEDQWNPRNPLRQTRHSFRPGPDLN